MGYLGVGIVLGIAAAACVYGYTGSFIFAFLAYSGAGVSVMIAGLVAAAVSLRFEVDEERGQVLS